MHCTTSFRKTRAIWSYPFFAIHHNMCSSVCLWLICIYCWTFNPPQTFDKTNHNQSHWSWTGQYNHNDLSWYKNQAQSPLLIWAQVLTHQGFTNSQFKLPFPDIYSRLFSERLAYCDNKLRSNIIHIQLSRMCKCK